MIFKGVKMKIKKEKLLIIAGALWGIAGANILRIGVTSYINAASERSLPAFLGMIALSFVILSGFGLMFYKVVKRNTKRILSYPAHRSVFAVFDLKGYLLMAFMMGLGIGLRASNILPKEFFAVFYSGLGSALLGAGVLFIRNYIKQRSQKAVQ